MNREIEFGKDLGLMHELVVMGRKIGFERSDWAKLAHGEAVLRATLNFSRSVDVLSFPSNLVESEKIGLLARLTKLVIPYMWTGHHCICCEANQGNGKSNGTLLLEGLAVLGIAIPSGDRSILSDGGCYQPWRLLFTMLSEVLGVEIGKEGRGVKDWGRNGSDTHWFLSCDLTPLTSSANLYAYSEALKKEGVELMVRVNLKNTPPS